jgi:hypothetical protein
MCELVLLLSLLTGSAESADADAPNWAPAWDRASELWPSRETAGRWLADLLHTLPDGTAHAKAEFDLFGPLCEEEEATTIELPTFVFSTVSSVPGMAEAELLPRNGVPRIIIQEEEEAKLGLSIPEEEAATRPIDRP